MCLRDGTLVCRLAAAGHARQTPRFLYEKVYCAENFRRISCLKARVRPLGERRTAKTPMAPRQRVELIALRFSGTAHLVSSPLTARGRSLFAEPRCSGSLAMSN